MTIETMQTELKDIEAQRDELAERAYELRQKIADELCPFSVGDRVMAGKHKYEIRVIKSKSYKPYWELLGSKIKKDGTPGVRTSTIYCWGANEITKIET